MNKKRRIMVFTGNRAEYGLLCPVMRSIEADPALELALVVAGGHFCRALGGSVSEIRADGFKITSAIRPPRSSMDTAGDFAHISAAMARILKAHRPDFLLVLGDRHESFAAAAAAACANVAIAHMAGGDTTCGGLKDDVFRHCISRLAHLHFPFTRKSADVLVQSGEERRRIICAGSPAADSLKLIRKSGIGRRALGELGIGPDRPFVIFTQHPEAETARGGKNPAAEAAANALSVLEEMGIAAIVGAPNNDPGWKDVMASIKKFGHVPFFRFPLHLGHERYLGLMLEAAAVVGNSSSGLLETPIAGTAAVNIGDRQKGRAQMGNAVNCSGAKDDIRRALLKALSPAFRKKAGTMKKAFGNGKSARKIAVALKAARLDERFMHKNFAF